LIFDEGIGMMNHSRRWRALRGSCWVAVRCGLVTDLSHSQGDSSPCSGSTRPK
jgi:hypothetical protein